MKTSVVAQALLAISALAGANPTLATRIARNVAQEQGLARRDEQGDNSSTASVNASNNGFPGGHGSHCYPGLGFTAPLQLPKSNKDWWCPFESEYAFVGFSYEVTACEFFVPHATGVLLSLHVLYRSESGSAALRVP
jgi:hypothetical protein